MKNHEFYLRQKLAEMQRVMNSALNQVRLGNTVQDQGLAKIHREEAERLLRETTEKYERRFVA